MICEDEIRMIDRILALRSVPEDVRRVLRMRRLICTVVLWCASMPAGPG
jgi:hypothetical protein